MLRRSIAILALLSTLLAIAGISLLGVGQPDVERPTAKLADRVLYYVAEHDRGPRFRVSGKDDELRFITHLAVPAGVEYDPRRVFSYGLRFVIRSPEGNELWRKEVFSESRQSKAGIDPRGWRLENTFSMDPQNQFTDDRTLRLSIPSDIPSLSELEVTTVADHDAVLVRTYRINPLGPAQRLVASLGASARDRSQLFERFTFLPWLALSDGQRSYAVTSRWERISAEGEPGRDYRTETVYFTGFRVPLADERATTEGLRLSNLRDAALAFHGPIDVDLLAVGGCAERFIGSSLHITHLNGAGQAREHVISTCPGALSLTFPAGPHSLLLRVSDADDPIYVHAFEHSKEPTGSNAPLDPDLRTISTYHIGPDQPIYTTTLATLPDLDSQVLSLSARRIFVEAPEVAATQWQSNVSYEFLGSDGDVLARGTWTPSGQMPIRFLDSVMAPGSDVLWLPSEAVVARVLAPAGARQIRVWSDQDLALTVSTFMHLPEEETTSLLPPYDDFLVGVRWRFAPLDRRSWYPLLATNHAEFENSLGAMRLVAPVRLELLQPSSEDPIDAAKPRRAQDLRWVSVTPHRFHERQIVLDRRESRSSPSDNRRVYTRIRPREEIRALIDDLDRTQLLYVSDATEDIGQEVMVWLDGQVHIHRLISSRGRLTLPIVGTGDAQIRLETTTTSTRFYLDRETADRRPRLAQRTLYRVDPRGLTVTVENDDKDVLYLNAIIYGCSRRRTGVQLEVILDEGMPRRISGKPFEHLTRSHRIIELPSVGETTDLVFLTQARRSCSELGHIVLAVGDDIVPGEHEFEIRATRGEDVWARFFHQAEPLPSAVTRTWTERGVSTQELDSLDD